MTAVRCLVAPTASVLAEHGHGVVWLLPEEAERIGRLRDRARRDDAVAAHVAARVCAAEVLGVDAPSVVIVQRCGACGGPHGRPRIAGRDDVGVSLAHSAGWIAAAAGPSPIGIDVERADRLTFDECPVAMAAHEHERTGLERCRSVAAFTRLWTRKEALVKAGAADLDGLRDIDLSAVDRGSPLWRGHRIVDLPTGDGAVIASMAVPAGVPVP